MTIVLDTAASGLTLSELLTEFYLRGYDYLNDGGSGETRSTRWCNQSINELCEAVPSGDGWPFLRGSTTGAAPLTITDVRQILNVVDTDQDVELLGLSHRDAINDISGDLTTTGTPLYWYLDGQILNVYPVSTDALSVRYVAVPTDLSSQSDVSVIPTRYSNIVIDMMVARGLRDSDNYDAERALRVSINEQIEAMAANLLFRGEQERVRLFGYSEDW